MAPHQEDLSDQPVGWHELIGNGLGQITRAIRHDAGQRAGRRAAGWPSVQAESWPRPVRHPGDRA